MRFAFQYHKILIFAFIKARKPFICAIVADFKFIIKIFIFYLLNLRFTVDNRIAVKVIAFTARFIPLQH